MNKQQAIISVYPTIVRMVGDEAFDANGSSVQYDDAFVQAYINSQAYKSQRAAEYPPMTDYLDGVVKGDQAQIDAYIAACQAVKAKYPK